MTRLRSPRLGRPSHSPPYTGLVVGGLEAPLSLLKDNQVRRPILKQHLQTSPPARRLGIPPPLVCRPWARPSLDPDGRATGDRQTQPGRDRRTSSPPGNPHRCPVGSKDLDRNRRWMDERR